MAYLLYTNVFVAFCAAALVTATRALLGAPGFPGVLEAHVWCATMTVYNIDRLVDRDDELHASPRHRWIARHRKMLWGVTSLSALGTLATMALLPLAVVLGLAPLAVISFLYSVPIFGADFRLKSLPGAKTFVIGMVWAVVTVVLPALELGQPVPYVMVAERFLFIFAITLPFELRDAERDAAAGVSSLAHVLGPHGTVAAAATMLLGVAVSKVFRMPTAQGSALGIALLITAGLVVAAVKPRNDWYYSLLLDGTMLLFAGAVLVG